MPQSMPHALIIDANPTSLSSVIDLAEQQGFIVSTAKSLYEARRLGRSITPDLAIVDTNLPDGSGLELLQNNDWGAGTQFLITSAAPCLDTSMQALRLKALDYIPKPIDYSYLREVLIGITKARGIVRRPAKSKSENTSNRFGLLIGDSQPMQRLYRLIERVAPTSVSVLIAGESGVGKELVARTLHDYSQRAKNPYVAINCGAISTDLIPSALFGHEKGSFTGAMQAHQGYFEQASGGTIFLDEITETSLDLQIKLLRVLETGKVIPVGGKRQINVNARVIAATNRDPEEAVRSGKLREDLYYRLCTFPLYIPPLNERGADIGMLALYFLEQYNQDMAKNLTINQAALDILQVYTWPGNVRELKNVLLRACIMADDIIADEHITFGKHLIGKQQTVPMINVELGTPLQAATQQLLLATLAYYKDDKKQAAEALGISLKSLNSYLGAYQGA